jgi:hypothetical protein
MPTQAAIAALAPSSAASVAKAAAPVASGPDVALSLAHSASAGDWAALIKPFTADALANGVATLIGALVGAMLAYALQRKFQRSQELKSELLSAHRLMFSLLHQINTVVLIQRDYVFAELKNRGRFLSIPATPPFDTRKNVVELTELSFLLGSNAGRAILYDFYMAQENYIEALNQWNLRSALHIEKIQPALAASGIPMGSIVTDADLQKAFGAHLFGAIVNSTDNSIESLKRSFGRLVAVKQKVRPYLVQRFGTSDFTEFEFPDTYGLTEPSSVAAPAA